MFSVNVKGVSSYSKKEKIDPISISDDKDIVF